jgi:hypothetical protein
MGQCGCGDFNASLKLPGPAGTLYAIQLYYPCAQCETGAAVIIHRLTEAEATQWGVPDLPEPRWAEYGEAAEHWIQVLDPDRLKERMTAFARESGSEYDPVGLVEDAVDHCLVDAIDDTRTDAAKAHSVSSEA